MSNLYLPIQSLIVLVILMFIFFSKKNTKSSETRIYGLLLIISFLNLLLNILGIYIAYKHGTVSILYILNHLDLPLYLCWVSFFFLYLSYILLKPINIEIYKLLRISVIFLNSLFLTISFFLPLEIKNDNGIMYAYGPSVNFIYVVCAVFLAAATLLAVILIIRQKEFKKVTPVLSLIFLGIIAIFIHGLKPELIVIPSIICFIELIMYFTIENPDLKTIEEINILKFQAEKSDYAKKKFAQRMGHEIKTPMNHAMLINSLNKDATDLKEVKENAVILENALQQINDIAVNSIVMSELLSDDIELNIKTYKSDELINRIKEFVNRKTEEKNHNIKTSIKINKKLPKLLDGDINNLFRVFREILSNSFKYTEKGLISLKIDNIIKDNVCTLIIHLKDTGIGMKKEDIPKLFNYFERIDFENNQALRGAGLGLSITKKLVELMNGEIKIKSEYGKGSEVMVEVKQRIVLKGIK